jgi:hypothetical protein
MPDDIVLDIARKSLFHDKAGLGDAAEDDHTRSEVIET